MAGPRAKGAEKLLGAEDAPYYCAELEPTRRKRRAKSVSVPFETRLVRGKEESREGAGWTGMLVGR